MVFFTLVSSRGSPPHCRRHRGAIDGIAARESLHDMRNTVNSSAAIILRVADALDILGMDTAADNLCDAVKTIRSAVDDAHDADASRRAAKADVGATLSVLIDAVDAIAQKEA